MKVLLGLFLAMCCSHVAHADIVKKAILDVICAEINAQKPRIIEIKSGPEGSEVTINGRAYADDEQLIGGTEGGDPYLQAVNNEGGYNIFMEGGDFKDAVYSSEPVINGDANATVDLFNIGQKFDAYCRGNFLFTSAF